MDWYQWIFSGIGGAIVVGVIGFIIKKTIKNNNAKAGINITGDNSGIILIGKNSNISKTIIDSSEKDKSYVQAATKKIKLSDIVVNITAPQNNHTSSHQVPVAGTIENYLPNYHLWLVKEPHKGNFHPDQGPAHIKNGEWFSTAI